jgi:hypothetical protein
MKQTDVGNKEPVFVIRKRDQNKGASLETYRGEDAVLRFIADISRADGKVQAEWIRKVNINGIMSIVTVEFTNGRLQLVDVPDVKTAVQQEDWLSSEGR